LLSLQNGLQRQTQGDDLPTGPLDDCCIELCVALLDHPLKGNLFESVVVGFLAALGIDTTNNTLRGPCNYTPMLSGFIKIGQMLALQKAVRAVECGYAEQPFDLLNEMRGRILTTGSCTPFS
jgi:hypothetical protein